MKKETSFLKFSLILMCIPTLLMSFIIISNLLLDPYWLPYNVIIAMYNVSAILILATIPYYMALVQGSKLLKLIDENKAFSIDSVEILKKIRNYAYVICALFIVNLPFIFILAEYDDAPGMILVGLFLVFVIFSVSVFANVLMKLFKNAFEMKTDNELTI